MGLLHSDWTIMTVGLRTDKKLKTVVFMIFWNDAIK